MVLLVKVHSMTSILKWEFQPTIDDEEGVLLALFLLLLLLLLSLLLLLLLVTLQALSNTPTNPHSCFAWSYKALAMLVDCMWSFGWRLEGGGEDHKLCNLFELT